MTADATTRPESDVDVLSEAIADNPYPTYRHLQDTCGVVYIRPHDYWILTRYDDVRRAAGDWATFSSAYGVALLPEVNAMQQGSVLAADPPLHTSLRSVLSDQLAPRALARLRTDIRQQAQALVDRVASLEEFDGITQLAQSLPVNVVADLIGIPREGRETLLPVADATFTTFGPATATLAQRQPLLERHFEWIMSMTNREDLAPGSWGRAILDAAEDGRIAEESAVPLMHAFLVAGMDTTANGIGAMIRVFAENPELWAELRANPSLAPGAFEEALRLESPVQGFFRVTTRDVEIDGVTIPAGSRVLLHFGAANRDERHYQHPNRYDLRRNPLDHLAFGYGNHGCAGQALARMEASAVLGALLERTQALSLTGPPVRHFNPVVRGLASLPMTIVTRTEKADDDNR